MKKNVPTAAKSVRGQLLSITRICSRLTTLTVFSDSRKVLPAIQKFACLFLLLTPFYLLCSCAGERQGIVCEEIEYRLNTQTYSPDQRAYIEEELRVCREEEARKRGEDATARQSIYDRYAASDSTRAPGDVDVSKALQDTSGTPTTSIYDRYSRSENSAEQPSAGPSTTAPAENPDEALDAGSFQ